MAALPQALHPLQPRVEALAARSQATAQTSGRPPASDAPYRTRRNTRHRPTSGRPGATPGPPGGRQRLMSPPATEPLRPTACCCGNPAWLHPTPDYTHQVRELPRIDMHSPHWVVSQADGPRCGRRLQAHRPPAHHSGDGPRRAPSSARWPGCRGPVAPASSPGAPPGLASPSASAPSRKSSTASRWPSRPPMQPWRVSCASPGGGQGCNTGVVPGGPLVALGPDVSTGGLRAHRPEPCQSGMRGSHCRLGRHCGP